MKPAKDAVQGDWCRDENDAIFVYEYCQSTNLWYWAVFCDECYYMGLYGDQCEVPFVGVT